jgi:uncharacterized protein YcgI (DUF1989 family)
MSERVTVPARKGYAVQLEPGQAIKVLNTTGTQVVDFWAVSLPDGRRVLSMSHTRAATKRLIPRAGDELLDSERSPMMRFVEDTSPGIHDTVMAACDASGTAASGSRGSTTAARTTFGRAWRTPATPGSLRPRCRSPFNLFMNIPWDADGGLEFTPSVSKPGDYVVIEAVVPCVAVVSSCPQDIIPINGPDSSPTEFDVEVVRGQGG